MDYKSKYIKYKSKYLQLKEQIGSAKYTDISKDNISIKATTNEKIGLIGRGEGIAAESIVSIDKGSAAANTIASISLSISETLPGKLTTLFFFILFNDSA